MRKYIKFVTLGLILVFLSSFSYAADDTFHGVRAKTRAYIGAQDETNGEVRMGKATPDGYLGVSALPSADSFVNVTTATDTDICQTGCTALRVIIGVGDAGTSVALYNDADGTCSSGLITTIDTATAGVVSIGLRTSVGLCMTSTGHDTGNVTVIYK
jgi:hypothetical protein